MRSPNRTSLASILFRYLLFGIPFAIFILFVFSAWPLVVLFFALMVLFFLGNWIFTNIVVGSFNPEYYQGIKAVGGDPFLDNMGAPFNCDSEEVRQQGLVPNVACPQCHNPMYIENDMNFQCGSCGLLWHGRQWTIWNGSQWVLYNQRQTNLPTNTIGMEWRSPDA